MTTDNKGNVDGRGHEGKEADKETDIEVENITSPEVHGVRKTADNELISSTIGRVKLTTFLGQTEKRKRENTRIINSCRTATELRAKWDSLKYGG